MLILNQGARDSIAVQSERVSADPGDEFQVTAALRNTEGTRVGLYIRFFDKNKKRINQKGVHTRRQTWKTVTLTEEAPEGTAFVSVMVWQGETGRHTQTFVDDVKLVKLH